MLTSFILGLSATAIFVAAIQDRTKKPSQLEHQFPFLVALSAEYQPNTITHICGGAIISKDYVLTSADCFSDIVKPDRMVAGSTDLSSGGTLHIITQTHIHQAYGKCAGDANIALVKVSPSFEFGPWIKPIALETKPLPPIVVVTFAGWGSIEHSDDRLVFPDTLMDVALVTISKSHCNDYGLNVTDRQVCTLTRVGQGLCVKDHGGPLIEERKIKTAMGVATKRYSCGNGLPDVYTKVAPFIS